MRNHPAGKYRNKESGFAMILSLALISFVFLLVITLVNQVRLELAYSDARQNQALAKAHARMGMMIAIGEIQKHLGPDMRISATADIYDERIDSALLNNLATVDLYGNGEGTIEELPAGQRMWTGVWKDRGVGSSKNLEDLRMTNPLPFNGDDAVSLTDSWDADGTFDHHPAIEMSWLISGNEGKKLALLGGNGMVKEHIEVPDGRAVTSEGNRLLPVDAGYEYGEFSNDWRDHRNVVENKLRNYHHPLVELPDPDENETVAWLLDRVVGDNNHSKVKVPKTALHSNDQTGKAWEKRRGAYAYWVGDEGVKAKIDFNASLAIAPDSRLTVAPHPHLDEATFDLGSLQGANSRILSTGGLSLFGDEWEEFHASHYHSVTTDAFGVLSDLRTGGLKRDLSLAFGQLAPGESPSRDVQTDFNDNFLFREKITYKKNLPVNPTAKRNVWLLGNEALIEDKDTLMAGPRWSVLASFHNTYRNMAEEIELTPPDQFPRIIGDNAVIFEGRPASPSGGFRGMDATLYFNSWDDSTRTHRPEPKNHSLLPVLVGLRLAVCPVMKPGAGDVVSLAVLPSVTLWNPYDKPLNLHNLFIEIPPSEYSLNLSIKDRDFKQYDLFRKWWMALYQRTRPFWNDAWENPGTYLEYDRREEKYWAIENGYVRRNDLIKLSASDLYKLDEILQEDIKSAMNSYILPGKKEEIGNFEDWEKGIPKSSLFGVNLEYDDSEKTLTYQHEDSNVTQDPEVSGTGFVPNFVFYNVDRSGQDWYSTVKDLRLQIMDQDYETTEDQLAPGEVVTFATFRGVGAAPLSEDFTNHIDRLIVPICRESGSSKERGFLLETDHSPRTGILKVTSNLTKPDTLAQTDLEKFNYDRRSSTFSYSSVPEVNQVKCITMFYGEDPTEDSPLALSRYTSWALNGDGARVEFETTSDYLKQNYNYLGTSNSMEDDNHPGWGWEIKVKSLSDPTNEHVLLNDFNFRALVHSTQHGKRNWVNPGIAKQPGVYPLSKAFSQPFADIRDAGFIEDEQGATVQTSTYAGKRFYFTHSSWDRSAGNLNYSADNALDVQRAKYGTFSAYVPDFYSIPDSFPYDPNNLQALGEQWHDLFNASNLSSDQRAAKMGLVKTFPTLDVDDASQSSLFDPSLNTLLERPVVRAAREDTKSIGFFSSYFENNRTESISPYNDHFTVSSAAVLFETPSNRPLSLLQYRHANLNNYLHGPSYAIGNSYASIQVARHRTWARVNHVYEEPTSFYGMGSLSANAEKEKKAEEYWKEYFKKLYPENSDLWIIKMTWHLKEKFSDLVHIPEDADLLDWDSIDPGQGYGPWRRDGDSYFHQNVAYDHSFYLNRSLLDGYFLSGAEKWNEGRRLDQTAIGERMRPFLWTESGLAPFDSNDKEAGLVYGNPRLVSYFRHGEISESSYGSLHKTQNFSGKKDKSVRYQTMSGDLLIDGAFNVNSTSVDAWISQLFSLRGISVENASVSSHETPVIRFIKEVADIDGTNTWNALRKLTDTEIGNLAVEIVRQVKLRGPFLSFADFVNRRLSPGPRIPGKDSVKNFSKLDLKEWIPETLDSMTGLRGAVQSAIAMSGLNDPAQASSGWARNQNQAIPAVPKFRWAGNKFHDSSFGLMATSEQPELHPPGLDLNASRSLGLATVSTDNYNFTFIDGSAPDSVYDHRLKYPGSEFGDAQENILGVESLATGACKPGWVMQSDLLAPLAPSMSARSDTFVVRVLGETNGKSAAKSWIEVVVQRTPDYVKPDIDAPHHRPHEPFMDQNLNGYWDESLDEPWTNLNFNKVGYPDLAGEKNSIYRDGMPSDLSLMPDEQEEDVNSMKGISVFGANQRFGRKFRIVKFRWLRQEDV